MSDELKAGWLQRQFNAIKEVDFRVLHKCISELEAENTRLREQLQQEADADAQIQETLKNYMSEIKQLQEQLQEAERERARVIELNGKYNEAMDKIQAENTALLARLEDAEAQVGGHKLYLKSAWAGTDSLMEENTKLTTERDALLAQNAVMRDVLLKARRHLIRSRDGELTSTQAAKMAAEIHDVALQPNVTSGYVAMRREDIPAALAVGWKRYTVLFGEPPHGTEKQMAALMELVVLFRVS